MHPILAHGRRLAWYLFIWSIVGLSFSVFLARRSDLSVGAALAVGLPLMIAFAFVCLSAWYVSRYTPLGKAGPVRLIGSAVGASVLSSAAWVALARGWCAALARWAGVDAPFETLGPIVFGFGQVAYLVSLAVSYVAGAAEQARAAEHRALQVQVLSREAELRSLRAQIDPHFLFNSLHSISALTSANPAGARRMCLLLAEFLRESLALGAEDRISLSRELALARKYLEVERVRFGDRLGVEIESTGADDCTVPSLILQPVVENAVTHGIAHLLGGGVVRIVTSCSPARIVMVVDNPCDADRPKRPGGGVGLANVRSRVRALYGTEASVTAFEQDGRWRVEISLPAGVSPGGDTARPEAG
jgi:two-component system, LytTR family, sensor histidine kinase AlgZ